MAKHKQTKKTGNATATATETAAVPVEEIEPVQVSAIEQPRGNFAHVHAPRGASFPGAHADAERLRAIVAARSQHGAENQALERARAVWRELKAKGRPTESERDEFARACAAVPFALRLEIYKSKG